MPGTRRISKTDSIRKRARPNQRPAGASSQHTLIGDLMGSVKGLPPDLSNQKKKYLPGLIGAKRH
jgi:hypothetical protein